MLGQICEWQNRISKSRGKVDISSLEELVNIADIDVLTGSGWRVGIPGHQIIDLPADGSEASWPDVESTAFKYRGDSCNPITMKSEGDRYSFSELEVSCRFYSHLSGAIHFCLSLAQWKTVIDYSIITPEALLPQQIKDDAREVLYLVMSCRNGAMVRHTPETLNKI